MKKLVVFLCCIVMSFAAFGAAACKTPDDPETIYIGIQVQGYGSKWLNDCAAAYTDKTGIAVDIKEFVVDGAVLSDFQRGGRNNNTDIYFTVADPYFRYIDSGVKNPSGIGFVDLSDVYAAKPEGYEGFDSIKDLIYDYAYESCLYEGTPYLFSWALGMEGIVYHENMLEEYGYRVPRTTDELIEICRDFTQKNTPASGNEADRTKYAVTWYEGYWLGRELEWWIQYEGLDVYNAFRKGQDIYGNYTPDVYAQNGRRESFEVLEELLSYENHYSDPGAISESFTTTQMKFLAGDTLFLPNGDWLEREMERNLQDLDAQGVERDFKFMRTPIISSITDRMTGIKSEPDLRAAISALDGEEGAVMPASAMPEDIEILQEAMNIVECQSQRQTGFIPNYSNNIDGAKDFIKFLYSKEAQMLIYNSMQGNVFPLKYDFTKEEGVETSVYQQSKYDLLLREDMTLIGNDYSHPMFYLGGMRYTPDISIPLASRPNSGAYQTAQKLYEDEYNDYRLNWTDILNSAGIGG